MTNFFSFQIPLVMEKIILRGYSGKDSSKVALVMNLPVSKVCPSVPAAAAIPSLAVNVNARRKMIMRIVNTSKHHGNFHELPPFRFGVPGGPQ